MLLEIPDAAIDETPLSAGEIRIELAIWLYAKKRLSFGQARKLAGFSVVAFQQALAEREIYLHFDAEDLENERIVSLKIP